jgi:hypothetical protein
VPGNAAHNLHGWRAQTNLADLSFLFTSTRASVSPHLQREALRLRNAASDAYAFNLMSRMLATLRSARPVAAES